MAVTSAVNQYVRYPTLYDGGLISLVNGANSASQKNAELFDAVKLAYQSRTQARTDQTSYRQQVKDFTAGTHSLYNSAVSLTYLPAKQEVAKTLQTAKSAVAAVNGLAGTLAKADNLTTRGSVLADKLASVMTGKSEDLKAIGITKNETTGQWAVDETKFKAAATGTPDKVRQTLSSLGGELASVARPAASSPAGEYVKMPAATNNSSTLKAMFSRGLFLDLMA